MGNPVVDNAYYDWLLNIINYDDTEYDISLTTLFNIEFSWDVANDDNRAEDGIVLRSTFMSEEGWNTSPCEDLGCSILEMMIALAIRIEDDIMWDGENNRTDKWFWEMFRNLGLDKVKSVLDVYDILEVFLFREYDADGKGGLFPLKNNNSVDAREIEIWYQAQLYLMENYGF